jgi:hypothetical protein
VGNFDQLITGDTSTEREFHVSLHCAVVVEKQRNDGRSIILSQRRLKCLNGFLGCGEAWVFHGLGTNPQMADELYVSAEPDALADIWGPMWKITKVGEPSEILVYDLEHGSLVPLSLVPNSTRPRLEVEPGEELYHWISQDELQVVRQSWF